MLKEPIDPDKLLPDQRTLWDQEKMSEKLANMPADQRRGAENLFRYWTTLACTPLDD